MVLNFTILEGIFETYFSDNLFLVRIQFKRISFVKLKSMSNWLAPKARNSAAGTEVQESPFKIWYQVGGHGESFFIPSILSWRHLHFYEKHFFSLRGPVITLPEPRRRRVLVFHSHPEDFCFILVWMWVWMVDFFCLQISWY